MQSEAKKTPKLYKEKPCGKSGLGNGKGKDSAGKSKAKQSRVGRAKQSKAKEMGAGDTNRMKKSSAKESKWKQAQGKQSGEERGKAKRGKESKAKRSEAKRDKGKQSKEGPGEAKQNRAREDKAEQGKTKQSSTGEKQSGSFCPLGNRVMSLSVLENLTRHRSQPNSSSGTHLEARARRRAAGDAEQTVPGGQPSRPHPPVARGQSPGYGEAKVRVVRGFMRS